MSSSGTDEYARRARYLPGLLALSPLWVVVIAAGWEDAKIVTGLVGLAGTIGLPIVLESFVRQQGKKHDEHRLPGSEGRFATTRMLLPGRPDPSEEAHNAQRRAVVSSATGVALDDRWPTDPAQQEEVVARIERAVAELRSVTRDRDTFWLLAAENADYGMWRNLYGVRTLGIVVSGFALVGAAVLAALSAAGTLDLSTSGLILGAAVAALLGVLWYLVPSQHRIRLAAAAYATALFDAALLMRARATAARTAVGDDADPGTGDLPGEDRAID